MQMSEDRCQEDQDEEDQRKTSKLIAYLSITGVSKISIVYSLKLIRITSN